MIRKNEIESEEFKMTTKFLYNGIKVDGTLYKAQYSIGNYTQESKIPQDTITITAKDYKHFPQIPGLVIKNDSDSMTDYFDNDRIRIGMENQYYDEALIGYQKQEAFRKKTWKCYK